MPGPLRESHTIVIKGLAAAGAPYKILIQEPPKSLPQELSYKPLRHDIWKLVTQGPFREHPTRISRRCSVEDMYRITQGPLREESSRISARALLREKLQWKCRPQTQSLKTPQRRHGHVTRTMWCENSQVKCRGPTLKLTFCASVHSRNADGHVTRAIWRKKIQVNAANDT